MTPRAVVASQGRMPMGSAGHVATAKGSSSTAPQASVAAATAAAGSPAKWRRTMFEPMP